LLLHTAPAVASPPCRATSYSFPNVDSATAKVVVRIPLRSPVNPSLDSDEITLTLPTGVFDLTEVAQQINEAVNTWLHGNHYPVLTGDWAYYDFRAGPYTQEPRAAGAHSL
jgi:hypothetical protein